MDLEEIDPIYYDHPYYLAPDTGAAKAYQLLVDAMEDAGKVAIARVVIRSKENLVAIRPRDGVLAMETMLFADEVVPTDSLEEMATDGDVKTSDRELTMARQLIDSLSSDFEPEKYHDEYRERVLDLIERKAQGETIVIEEPTEEPEQVPDLMAALEASIAGAKGQASSKGQAQAQPKKRRPPSAKKAATPRAKTTMRGSGHRARRYPRDRLHPAPPPGWPCARPRGRARRRRSRSTSRATGSRCPTSTRSCTPRWASPRGR